MPLRKFIWAGFPSKGGNISNNDNVVLFVAPKICLKALLMAPMYVALICSAEELSLNNSRKI
ncbi:hypothetical protein GCM10027190_49760 [Spirosoma areae]